MPVFVLRIGRIYCIY